MPRPLAFASGPEGLAAKRRSGTSKAAVAIQRNGEKIATCWIAASALRQAQGLLAMTDFHNPPRHFTQMLAGVGLPLMSFCSLQMSIQN
jgi:hypothetical protein